MARASRKSAKNNRSIFCLLLAVTGISLGYFEVARKAHVLSVRSLTYLVIVSLFCAGPANLFAAQSGDIANKFAIELGVSRISGDAIRKVIAGKRWRPNKKFSPGAFLYSEEFQVNGTWRSDRQERGLSHFEGTWSVIGDQVCIHGNGIKKICRPVYRDKDGRILVADWLEKMQSFELNYVDII